jgi:hypothetical protein
MRQNNVAIQLMFFDTWQKSTAECGILKSALPAKTDRESLNRWETERRKVHDRIIN